MNYLNPPPCCYCTACRAKFDIKAEMFRAAASQYRILSTKLEERIRLHRHLLSEIELEAQKDPEKEDKKVKKIKGEKDAFLRFFNDSYLRIATCQSEMKFFPPGHMVRKWVANGQLRPNPIDQPMARFDQVSTKLSEEEKTRALFMLTDVSKPYKRFQALPEVKEALKRPKAAAESKKTK